MGHIPIFSNVLFGTPHARMHTHRATSESLSTVPNSINRTGSARNTGSQPSIPNAMVVAAENRYRQGPKYVPSVEEHALRERGRWGPRETACSEPCARGPAPCAQTGWPLLDRNRSSQKCRPRAARSRRRRTSTASPPSAAPVLQLPPPILVLHGPSTPPFNFVRSMCCYNHDSQTDLVPPRVTHP